MPGKGIDHGTCPKARVARSLWTEAERAFAGVLMRAFRKKVNVFLKVRVSVVVVVGRGRIRGGAASATRASPLQAGG